MAERHRHATLGTLMWTPITRRQHSRNRLRYETDLTDAEWALIEPLMPKPLARGREWSAREIMNAIFYVLRGGGGPQARHAEPHGLYSQPGALPGRGVRGGLVPDSGHWVTEEAPEFIAARPLISLKLAGQALGWPERRWLAGSRVPTAAPALVAHRPRHRAELERPA